MFGEAKLLIYTERQKVEIKFKQKKLPDWKLKLSKYIFLFKSSPQIFSH